MVFGLINIGTISIFANNDVAKIIQNNNLEIIV